MFQPPFWGPAYLYARCAEVDVFILSGTDQHTAKSPNLEGKAQRTGQVHTLLPDGWWNLPVKDSLQPVDDTRLAIDQRWIDKAMRRLDYLFWDQTWQPDRDTVRELLQDGIGNTLGNFNSNLFAWGCEKLNIQTTLLRDYEVAERADNPSDTALLLALGVGATEYVTGGPGLTYLDLDAWDEAGVKVTVQDWTPPPGVEGGASVLSWLYG